MCPTAQKQHQGQQQQQQNGTLPCSCAEANADPATYSAAYKTYLKTYLQAQIYAFEKGYGWFYWTWDTEVAAQWSWRKGRAAGTVPQKAYSVDWKCGDRLPDFSGLPENY